MLSWTHSTIVTISLSSRAAACNAEAIRPHLLNKVCIVYEDGLELAIPGMTIESAFPGADKPKTADSSEAAEATPLSLLAAAMAAF